jgi:N-methylhydantoinase A
VVKPPAPARKAPRKAAGKAKHVRKVFDGKAGKILPTPVYWRFDLKPGATLKGPAIIAEHETSTIVASGFSARIDSVGYIHLERNA